MDITPLVSKDKQIIQSYSEQGFKVSGTSYDKALIVTPDQTVVWEADVLSADNLSIDDFTALIEHREFLDVVLLGTGHVAKFLKPELKKELQAQKLHVEIMDTGAACRTYNVLMSEGRRVAAALLPLS